MNGKLVFFFFLLIVLSMDVSSVEKQYTLNWLYNWLAQTINETAFNSQEKEHLKNRSKSTKLAAITSLQRSWCRPMQLLCLLFQSVSPCERCLVDSVAHVILVSSIPSRSYSISPFPFLLGSQISKGRVLMETSYLDSLSASFLAVDPICCQLKPMWWWLNKAQV